MSAEASRVFSDDWAEKLGVALRGSDAYRRAASRWRGSLVLARAGAPEEAVFLDLEQGECRAARRATDEDRRTARFLLEAPLATWKAVLEGEIGAIPALLQKRILVERGRLIELVPHTAAARELVACARSLRTTFPDPGQEAGARGEAATVHRSYRSLSGEGLARESPPMVLWQKAKRHGIWNPTDVDLTRDRSDWLELDPGEQRLLLQLATLFGAGEESVALDLLPLIQVVAAEERLEEEMYLTSFLWEEAKHVETFRRFFDEVAGSPTGLEELLTPSHARIFSDALPEAMGRLRTDASPHAVAEASTTYNMIVEGVLAETGYHTYYSILEERSILPGMQTLVRHLQADESRHLAYGVFLLSRLVAEHGEPVWRTIEATMEALLEPALGIVQEVFDQYLPDVPFGLELDPFTDFAADQFERRRRRIERSRGLTLDQIMGTSPDPNA